MTEGLQIEVADKIATVTLNQPDRLNALSRAMMHGIVEAFDAFNFDEDVWAVVITGSGDRAFCAGVDLKEVNTGDQKADESSGSRRFVPASMPNTGLQRNVFETILECRRPVIAALNGLAHGGGLEVAIASDIRLAAEGIKLAFPEAKRGMGANFGNQLLPRLIPRGLAFEMLYTGDFIDVETAKSWGLVNHIYPREQLLDEAHKLAAKIVANAPLTVRRYKEMIVKGAELPISAALRLNVGPNPYLSEDRVEGVAAFVEKRTPQWKAR